MWNHTTSTIDIPDRYKNPFGGNGRGRRPLTSLEILQEVLHGETHLAEFDLVDRYVRRNFTGRPPSCLVPDVRATQRLAERVVEARSREQQRRRRQRRLALRKRNARRARNKEQRRQRRERSRHGDAPGNARLPLPILNVGYPKAGSTTLQDYLDCIGLTANHGQNGFRILEHLDRRPHAAFAQLDLNSGRGEYPQISFLDELHEVRPRSTFVFVFRPLRDWIRSVRAWHNLFGRMSAFTVPGLVLRPDQLSRNEKIHALKAEIKRRIAGGEIIHDYPVGSGRYKPRALSKMQLAKWLCGHALHVREYVKEYPSHALIELDLYDSNGTGALLHDLFQADAQNTTKRCWGHSNKLSDHKLHLSAAREGVVLLSSGGRASSGAKRARAAARTRTRPGEGREARHEGRRANGRSVSDSR